MVPLYVVPNNGTLSSMVKPRKTHWSQDRDTVLVPTMDLLQLAREYRTTFVKVDIEGGEYGLDLHLLPPWVVKLAIEFHIGRASQRIAAANLAARLAAAGWKPVQLPELVPPSKRRWRVNASWRR